MQKKKRGRVGHSVLFDNEIEISGRKIVHIGLILAFFGIGFASGGLVESFLRGDEELPLRISMAALNEIYLSCMDKGLYEGLSANKEFVYANCKDGTPITVQNYYFK